MTTLLRCGPADLLRLRFAISPLWETAQAVRLLAHPADEPWQRRWRQEARSRTAELDLRPLHSLMPARGNTPDFLTPPPTGPGAAVEQELARVRATPPDQVRTEIDRSLADTGASEPEWLRREPGAARDRLVDLLGAAWRALVAPSWPVTRDLLEADIAHHSRRLARGGAQELLAGIDRRVRWDDSRQVLEVRGRASAERDLGGEGLVLMPSSFVWPDVAVVTDPPWQPTLIYPARGVAALWSTTPADPDRALARLLGVSRAKLLASLEVPSTTSRLSRSLGLSPAAVSEHLGVLHDAGLVRRRRVGREVEYDRTTLGAALLARRPPTGRGRRGVSGPSG